MLKYLLTIPTLIYICTIFHSFFKIKDIDSVINVIENTYHLQNLALAEHLFYLMVTPILLVICYFIIPKLLNIADFIPQLSNMALLKKLLTQMQSEFIMIFVWNVIMLFQIS